MHLFFHLRLFCPSGPPRYSSFVCEQKILPQPKPGREILEQVVNLRGRPIDTHLLAAGMQLERGKGKLVRCWAFFLSFLIKIARFSFRFSKEMVLLQTGR